MALDFPKSEHVANISCLYAMTLRKTYGNQYVRVNGGKPMTE